jgi:oligopeptide/dipeptide ABC transporter ATP-binding protein
MTGARSLLSVHGIVARLAGEAREVMPARDVSLELAPGEIVGLVGETGSGKSLTARAIIGLLEPDGVVEAGDVQWDGHDLLRMPRKVLRALRGREIALATKDAGTSLDPLKTIGAQLVGIHRRQTGSTRRAARDAAVESLRHVGVAEPELRMKDYAHNLAPGTRQRVLLAMALVCKPRLLIADEPTTGLDTTAQAELLALLAAFRRDHGMAVLLITPDISLAARICGRLLVMYAGRMVETGPTAALIATPRHPYTRALVGSVPRGTRRDGPLPTIRGEPVDLADVPSGCVFQARCPEADPACRGLQSLRLIEEGRRAACWRAAAPKLRP